MDTLYQRVKSILNQRRADLELVTSELIKQETLERAELEKLLAASKQPSLARQ